MYLNDTHCKVINKITQIGQFTHENTETLAFKYR